LRGGRRIAVYEDAMATRAARGSQKMQNQREFQRYRTDVTLDFGGAGSKVTGMTWDVSLGGMFVRTSRMPEVGQKLLVTLRFPEGRQLLVQAEVVRILQPSALLRDVVPAGFGVSIRNGDSYKRFVESVAAAVEPAPISH
jgi:Tfp pilus assembly protein PilZ